MKKSVDLSVTVGPIRLQNPVMVASGTFGYGREFADFVPLEKLGAVIVKGISLTPRPGNPPPRIVETTAGLINSIGLENVGVEVFLKEKLPYLQKRSVPVIVNIFGERVEEYRELAEILDNQEGIIALEVNISCPNVSAGGLHFGADPESAAKVIETVKENTSLPVMVKLSPQVTSIALIARAVEEAGADIISCINTIPAMAVDIYTRKPRLGNVVGGLSGPAIKPIALRCVFEVVRAVKIPVVGVGGIATPEDALEFLLVGARAVQVGSVNFTNPRASLEIIEGIARFLSENNFATIEEYIGTLQLSEGDPTIQTVR
ncbi:dihydroorotate dehydrogenase [Thermodesulforhabdus norvegica]|uniref:Dihydroorotate dehydrogenase n=1 Tax=Thermodesulforhabdus norvegica TaxID=39841 RepID=A0A1I4QR80_9BACT|nr:dihydroorotate dehydrogenase [Thermodesulforhabdus norvegica]SFM42541.1 dihydroorotate oxidase B, catalytic subunit [Thermodesulforhabdus norvegica]